MSTTQTVSTRRPRRPGLGSKLVNRLVLSIAGTRFFPFYGVIAHRGRHSGKIYRTPVVVRGIRGGLVVPMPWGETTDWYRNVRAAGGGVIRWKGRDYPVAQPEIIEAASAAESFGPVAQAIVTRMGISQCLRLRHRGAEASALGTEAHTPR